MGTRSAFLVVATTLAASSGAWAQIHTDLITMPEQQRNTQLALLVSRVDKECKEITYSDRNAHKASGRMLWDVRCRNGTEYQVQFQTDSTRDPFIAPCALVAVSQMDCFGRFARSRGN
jgi:hypothetical protein